MILYLYQIFFIKATKAAGQSRLSKFEAVECSKIGHSYAVSTNPARLCRIVFYWHGHYVG